MERRSFLALGGFSVSVGLGGCLGAEIPESISRGGLSSPEFEVQQTLESTDEPPEHTDPLTQFQYDARNAGVSADSVPETVDVRWNTTVPPIDGGMAAADGRLVIAAGGELIALDADDGAERWAVRVGHDTDAAPALTADTAYVTTWNGGANRDRGVAAIALEDGRQRWRALPSIDVGSAPTLADGTVYVGGSLNSDAVVALDAVDGHERWRFEAGQYATTPAVADGIVYVGGGSEHVVYALDAETGDEVWRVSTDDRAFGAPTVVGETVYVASRSGRLYALDIGDGDERWRAGIGSDVSASVAATDDAIYVSAGESVTALDTDGTERWSVETGDGAYAPTVAGDAVLAADREAAIRFDAADGDVLWRREGEQRSISDMMFTGIGCEPIVADGVAFVASHGGAVHALQAAE